MRNDFRISEPVTIFIDNEIMFRTPAGKPASRTNRSTISDRTFKLTSNGLRTTLLPARIGTAIWLCG